MLVVRKKPRCAQKVKSCMHLQFVRRWILERTAQMKLLDLDSIFDPDGRGQRPEVAITTPNHLPADWQERWQERAAIMQYDGKLSAEQANAEALKDILGQVRSDEQRR